MPDHELDYVQNCPFCYNSKNSIQSSAMITFADNKSYGVMSLSNQMLVIPVEHYSHLFAAPLDMQIIILKNIFTMRHVYSNNIQRPIEFHC